MNIKPLFSVPIGYTHDFITEKERLELYKSIKSLTHIPHNAIKGNGNSTHGLDVNFLPKKIKNRVQDAVDEYTKEYGSPSVKITTIWSNIQNSGSTLDEHTHPRSIISGALYINVGDKSELCFHNPNPYIGFTLFKENRNHYNYEWYKIEVKNCQLVLFPSWLKHGKNDDINQIDDRMVVSFNFE